MIDDVQRTGFVHAIEIEAKGQVVTLSATVADTADGGRSRWPVLRLAFKNDALREFIYALWKQFLAENCRKKKMDGREETGAHLRFARQQARTAGVFPGRRGGQPARHPRVE